MKPRDRQVCLLLLLVTSFWAVADEAHIDRIELLSTNLVTIHFGTQPNRTYTLQYCNSLPNIVPPVSQTQPSTNSNRWSNLTTIPAFPFANHYVLVDSKTNLYRFYRLMVTP